MSVRNVRVREPVKEKLLEVGVEGGGLAAPKPLV